MYRNAQNPRNNAGLVGIILFILLAYPWTGYCKSQSDECQNMVRKAHALWAQQKKFDAAVKLLNETIKDCPGTCKPEALMELSLCYEIMGNRGRSESAKRQLLTSYPSSTAAGLIFSREIRQMLRENDLAEATKLLQRWQAAKPSHPWDKAESASCEALVMAATNPLEGARELEQIADTFPSSHCVRALWDAYLIYKKLEDRESSIRVLQGTVHCYPSEPLSGLVISAYQNLANEFLQSGDDQSAIATWKLLLNALDESSNMPVPKGSKIIPIQRIPCGGVEVEACESLAAIYKRLGDERMRLAYCAEAALVLERCGRKQDLDELKPSLTLDLSKATEPLIKRTTDTFLFYWKEGYYAAMYELLADNAETTRVEFVEHKKKLAAMGYKPVSYVLADPITDDQKKVIGYTAEVKVEREGAQFRTGIWRILGNWLILSYEPPGGKGFGL